MTTDTSAEAVHEALYLLECGEPNESLEDQKRFIAALAAERDAPRLSLAEARNEALDEAAAAAYGMPAYGHTLNPDDLGRIKPGSPYDRGGYDAANAILALKTPTGDTE